MKYEPTIGIECHVQLNTKTKLFSGASNDERGKEPNEVTSPICFGLPGTLPVLNEAAIELGIKAGIALNAEIAQISSFDRKHYFYPDLPKGYQITQMERPIVGKGKIDVPLGGESFEVRITRAHLEEDAGKLTHPTGADYSLVDLNRAGTPLLEIVSEPDMHSAAQARAYAEELYILMKYAEVTLGDLQHGNMRFDVNVSVAPEGAGELGTRAEVKNLNSFRSVERAVEFELKRQSELLEKGGKVKQETRGFEDATGKTFSQRSKEEAQDYRYFPEADVPPVVIKGEHIEEARKQMPPLPPELRKKFANLKIDSNVANTLIVNYALYGGGYLSYPLAVGDILSDKAAKFVANFLVNRFIKRRIDEPNLEMPAPRHFVGVFELFESGDLSSNAADELLFKIASEDDKIDVRDFATRNGLIQENDESALEAMIEDVLKDPASQKAVEDIKGGNEKAVGYLVGQIMKKSQGRANPGAVAQLINKKLKD